MFVNDRERLGKTPDRLTSLLKNARLSKRTIAKERRRRRNLQGNYQAQKLQNRFSRTLLNRQTLEKREKSRRKIRAKPTSKQSFPEKTSILRGFSFINHHNTATPLSHHHQHHHQKRHRHHQRQLNYPHFHLNYLNDHHQHHLNYHNQHQYSRHHH
ncbi:unnamed protein product [Nesidiocoris tenuis]|uniref:Uncharacterized protein n=1 Tax=Nesidiocoris tenuis TaxID=355587 RepID=A0A6H5GDD4_9HEMI|nr:unnamed protein product [Nesidiocoris tenuis]